MKIFRLQDDDGNALLAAEREGRLWRLAGGLPGGTAPGDWRSLRISDQPVTAVRHLPLLKPRAIICIGLNYRRHAEESGLDSPADPVVFLKNPASVIASGEAIRVPRVCRDEVDYEAELAVVIGRDCRNVPLEHALEYVSAYTAANDVSARLWQTERGGTQWARGKSFDTFAPLGPCLVTPDEIPDPNALQISTRLNGRVVQNSNTRDMIFDVPTLLSFLSQDTTLLAGTVILTGTPEGIGWARAPKLLLQPGDLVEVNIDGIGTLSNPVAAVHEARDDNHE